MDDIFSPASPGSNFYDVLPRSVSFEANPEFLDRKGATFTGVSGINSLGLTGNALMQQISQTGASNSILRNPSRRFYDPEITTTAIYLPRTTKQKNRWCRWFYDHDELIGAVLDAHVELAHSKAEFFVDDPYIRRQIHDCIDRTHLFTRLSQIDLEFLKIGEVIVNLNWDSNLGMWNHIVIHNPDFVEVRFTPFADQECSIELVPDDELKKLVHSTKPEDQQLKSRLPDHIFRRVLTGKNISLNPDEVVHIARRSNPTDVRGTSIIQRLFRTLMYEDKLRESQITIADNFVYPLRIFKLGDPQKGWIPNETHQRALAQMLQQATFDPNFSLIYHYGLNVETVTVADKVMKLDKEFSIIDERKMVALGVGKGFLTGEQGYACFSKGTKVTTPVGYKKIEDLEKNDIVIDKNGKSQKVIDNWSSGKPHSLLKIKLWGGKEFICTPNHQWPVWTWPRECACGCGKPIESGRSFAHPTKHCKDIKLQKLECGRSTIRTKEPKGAPIGYDPLLRLPADRIKPWDYLMIPRKFNEIKTEVTKEQALLLGYFVAEGNFSKHHTTKEITGINLTFGIKERDTLVKEAVYLCDKIGLPIIQIEEKTNSLRLRSANRNEFKDIVLWFKKNAGEYSNKKQLSEEVMSWPLDLKQELIKGMFRGDGCQRINNKNPHSQFAVHYTTTSEVLAYQLELILAQLGFPVNWTIQDCSKRGRKTLYRFNIHGKFAFDLAKIIWGKDSKLVFDDTKKFLGQKAWVDDNYVYIMVKSITKIENTEKVYNLTIEDTHSYLVNNIGTYNSANVALQMQLARYKFKRDLYESIFLRDKFFRVMAERNEWYKRDKRELVGQFRVKRTGKEQEERLIMPKIVWHKKFMMRDDQAFIAFMNNVYAQGKGPISAISLLQFCGMSLEEELENKRKGKELEQKIGEYIHPVLSSPGPAPSSGAAGITAKIKDKFKFGKNAEIPQEVKKEETTIDNPEAQEFVKAGAEELDPAHQAQKIKPEDLYPNENEYYNSVSKMINPVDDNTWFKNIESSFIPSEVRLTLINLNNKLSAIDKKYNGNFVAGINEESDNLNKLLNDLYKQGKLFSYNTTNFYPVYREYFASNDNITDYSDLILTKEFDDWMKSFVTIQDLDKKSIFKHIRNLGSTCFDYGQLKGFQEQGIYTVKVSNVISNDGIQYSVIDLLSKGRNLNPLISPKDEIAIFYPCIEGFDDEEFGNNVDPHIQRYSNYSVNGINVSNCPVEYSDHVFRFLTKLGKVLKKKYSDIVFIKDIIDLPEWETSEMERLKKKYADVSPKESQSMLVKNSLDYEKIQKRGKVPVFEENKKLYISNWIGMEDNSITESLLRYINLVDSDIEKSIKKAFKQVNCDLTAEELQTYKIFSYIEPISSDIDNPRGYKISEITSKNQDLDYKLRTGKMWDSEGKCINSNETDQMQIFRGNVRMWVDYPHFLDKSIRDSFEEL
jgi:hypothetical protein